MFAKFKKQKKVVDEPMSSILERQSNILNSLVDSMDDIADIVDSQRKEINKLNNTVKQLQELVYRGESY